jgi:hypothetical protein
MQRQKKVKKIKKGGKYTKNREPFFPSGRSDPMVKYPRSRANPLFPSLPRLSGKTGFAPPEPALFTVRREDPNAKARTYREMGLPLSSFYGRENDIPGDIKGLLENLKAR